MSLRGRLLLGVGLTAVTVLGVATAALVERRTEVYRAPERERTLALVRATTRLQPLAQQYARAATAPLADSLTAQLVTLRRTIDSLAGGVVPPDRLQVLSDRVAQTAEAVQERARADSAEQRRALSDAITAGTAGLVGEAIELDTYTRDVIAQRDRLIDDVVFAALALLVLVVMSTSWWLVRNLLRRVEALHTGAMALASGELGYRVPEAGHDELGTLVSAFNRMARELEGALTYARRKVEERVAAQAVLERRVRQQAVVVELGRLALSGTSLDELEDHATRLVADGLEVELVGVLAAEPDGGRLRLVAGVGWDEGTVGRAAVDAVAMSEADSMLGCGTPAVVDDLGAETRVEAPALLASHGVRSGVSVVIDGPGRAYGVLGAHTRDARKFSADDVAFVQSVAHLLAQAVAARSAQDALRASEQRYQDLYDNAPSGYWSVHLATGRILACNATAAQVTGYTREELVGKPALDLYAPESHAAARAGMRQLQEQGEVRDLELLARRRDGTVFDVSLQATAVRDETGAVVASRSTWRDITERKRAERALTLSLDRLAQAERAASMGHWHYDVAAGQLTWSEGHCRLFGIGPDEFEGTIASVLAMVHPNDRAGVDARMRWYIAENRGGESEYRVVRADGEVRYMRATAEVALDASGVVTSMFGTSTDVTDRRRLEEQLRHVVEHSSNVFYSHTPEHLLTYVSPQVREVLDCEPEEALIRWTEFLTDHPENQVGLAATERAIATGQRQPPYELQLRTPRGRVIWVEVREAPLVRDGQTVAIVGALTDITERRRIEAALRLERELLDRTVNNVPVMIGLFDPAGRVQFVNRAWERILGWTLGECRAHPDLLLELYPDAAERERNLRHIRDASGDWDDFRTHVRNGRILDTMWANIRLSDGSLISIGQDITERKAAELALVESEERLRLAVSAANQGLFDADVPSGVSIVSPEYCRMLGYEPDELEMTHPRWLELMHPDDRDVVAGRYGDYIAGRRPDYQAEFRLRAKDGSWKWILAAGRVVEWDAAGRPRRFLGTHTDITARRQAEEEVRASRERLREMAFAQEQTREAERAQLARELHDEMGQALTGFKMDLSWLRERLPVENATARERAEEALALVDTMVDVVRRMSGELRPGVLDDLGLAAAIRWQVREFGRRAGIPVDVCGLEEIPEMDEGRALAVFRILQEALTNVARHAAASHIEIVAAAIDSRLRLEVRDDGAGFKLTTTDRTPLGILGMQERAAAWGGTVAIGPRQPRGTVVMLEMPCAEAEGSRDLGASTVPGQS